MDKNSKIATSKSKTYHVSDEAEVPLVSSEPEVSFNKIVGPVSVSQSDIEMRKLMKVEALLNNFLVAPPTIDELSRLSAMSPTKLKKDFKNLYGFPIYVYYQKNKMHKAKSLLSSGTYSVREVSTMVGYLNFHHFEIAFKKEFQVLPDEYLNNIIVKPVVEKATARSRITFVIVETDDKPEWKMTPVEKMEMFREGISKQKLETLKRRANLDYDKLSTLLSTTRATLINKKGKDHFSPALSERIVSIADVYSYGYEVFEDESKFNEWITRPNRALGGKQPFDLLDNQFGREEVKNVIGRIEYGVYS